MTRCGGWLSMEISGCATSCVTVVGNGIKVRCCKGEGLSTTFRRKRWCRMGSKHKETIGMNCIGVARTERPF